MLNYLLIQNFLINSFRRQHDQLRLVINRVLRPVLSQEPIVSDENGTGPSITTHLQNQQSGLDVADANAIEVNKYKNYF